MTRRVALGAVAAIAGTAVALREIPRLMRPRYKPTPYDDLLGQLTDRESAAGLGRRILAETTHFDSAATVRLLRARMSGKPLSALMMSELSAGQMTESSGWVLPRSFPLICALAAQA